MARNPLAADAARQRFAALLDRHLKVGTRPATAAGEPWTYAEFASELPSNRSDDAAVTVSPRSASNWCKGKALPEEIEPVLRALFGPSDRHAAAREELRGAFQAARAEKNAAILARANAKPDPAGATWVVEGGRFALDRTMRPSDRRAAADPLRQQLQHAIRAAAADLAKGASRLSNTRAWAGLSRTAADFGALVAGDPLIMPDQLGAAYPLLLRLGRCLETDRRLQRDPARMDEPLDADIHGLLLDLVRIAAPWLRGFPTVAQWDDEAGKALARVELFRPAGEFLRIARDREAISGPDATEIEGLAETAGESDFPGEKAGVRAVGSARNLLIAGAEAVAASQTLGGTLPVERERLVARAAATLAAARDQVEAFAKTLPEDLSQALLAVVETGGQPGDPTRMALTPGPPVPDNLEAQARSLILSGQAPPAAWRPFIRELDFRFTDLASLALLAGLSGLQSLDLARTHVSDLSPLAGLSGLRNLNLWRTQVSDLSLLAGLSDLQSLTLMGTQVSDLSPLAGLSGLQSLNMMNTQVRDVSPLAGLSGLQSLNLWRTQVSDVSSLAGLSGLQSLDLRNTQVRDVSPLAGLSGLQSLDLRNTQVSDVSPLAGLAAQIYHDLPAAHQSVGGRDRSGKRHKASGGRSRRRPSNA